MEVIDRSSLSIVAHGSQQGGLYHITSFSSHQSLIDDSHLHQLFASHQALLSKEANDLWHSRFGHVSPSTLQQLFSKSMVTGLPKPHIPRDHVCSSCAMGKLHRASFPLEGFTLRATRILELVHVDLAGPMEVSTLGGSHYYMLLVDDYSRKKWVYFLCRKADALSHFQQWLALVETQAQCKLSSLRSDNGGEFVAFDGFLASKGIHHQTTIPYTPSQNGVVERKNRTVKEIACTMLYHANLPTSFWGEAIATSVIFSTGLLPKLYQV